MADVAEAPLPGDLGRRASERVGQGGREVTDRSGIAGRDVERADGIAIAAITVAELRVGTPSGQAAGRARSADRRDRQGI
ncbi:MAG: hypothetical protein ABIV94_05735, partial [Acidimicrobiales bacterium]